MIGNPWMFDGKPHAAEPEAHDCVLELLERALDVLQRERRQTDVTIGVLLLRPGFLLVQDARRLGGLVDLPAGHAERLGARDEDVDAVSLHQPEQPAEVDHRPRERHEALRAELEQVAVAARRQRGKVVRPRQSSKKPGGYQCAWQS